MGKAEETKARVERAALTLFVARGVAETTTREIALAASIAAILGEFVQLSVPRILILRPELIGTALLRIIGKEPVIKDLCSDMRVMKLQNLCRFLFPLLTN